MSRNKCCFFKIIYLRIIIVLIDSVRSYVRTMNVDRRMGGSWVNVTKLEARNVAVRPMRSWYAADAFADTTQLGRAYAGGSDAHSGRTGRRPAVIVLRPWYSIRGHAFGTAVDRGFENPRESVGGSRVPPRHNWYRALYATAAIAADDE